MKKLLMCLLLLSPLNQAAHAEETATMEMPDSLMTVDYYNLDPEAVGAVNFEAQLISQSPSPATLNATAGQMLSCNLVFDNVGQSSWTTSSTSRVELRSTDSLGTQASASLLASGWLSSSTIMAVSATVLARYGIPRNAANSCSLSWTAPGDDGTTGTAAQFDLRFGTSPITVGNWNSFARFTTASPQAPGTKQSAVMTGLTPSTTYHFNIRTADEVPNWSSASNAAQYATASVRSTFTFALRAPMAPGRYVLFLKLYNSGTGYFSGTPIKLVINVAPTVVPSRPTFALILRNPTTGQCWMRTSTGGAFGMPSSPNNPPDLAYSAWPDSAGLTYTLYSGDLNGDGYTDLIGQRSDAIWYVAWNNQNNTFTGQVEPILNPWGTGATAGKYFFALANVFGDAKDELVTYDAANANWYVCSFNASSNTFGGGAQVMAWGGGLGTFQPLIGDWNGDGRDDLCLRNWNTGQHWVRLSNGVNGFIAPGVDLWATWGAVPSPDLLQPHVGDWNGDGRDEFLLLNPISARWYVRTSTGSAFVYPAGSNDPADTWAIWMGSGYRPFTGDFNEDGESDIGLRNSALGDHWVRLSSGLAFYQPPSDNWQAGWGASPNFQLLTGRFGSVPSRASAAGGPLVDVTTTAEPLTFSLKVGPNPMVGQGNIHLTLPTREHVRLQLFDAAGRSLGTVVDRQLEAGLHSFTWLNPREADRSLSAGMYFLRFTSAIRTSTTKFVVSN